MAGQCSTGIDTGFVTLGYAKVAMLGVVQGITELLPISSTAHMRVVPAVLGWRDPGSAFSAAMQLAALAAVISYFWRDVRRLAVGSVSAISRREFADPDLRLATWIVLATIPIALAGALLSSSLNTCNSPLRALPVIGWACIVMAVLMALTEILARHRRSVENASLVDALLVGLAQVGALIPGVSRSGSTLTATLALGFRVAASGQRLPSPANQWAYRPRLDLVRRADVAPAGVLYPRSEHDPRIQGHRQSLCGMRTVTPVRLGRAVRRCVADHRRCSPAGQIVGAPVRPIAHSSRSPDRDARR